MGDATEVRNSLRELRFQSAEMTQQDLADRAGVTRQTIVAIEGRKYAPSLELAFRIAAVFGKPLETVFQWGLPRRMAGEIQVFHKPTCSKCRAAVDLLRERGADFCTIDYYQDPLTPEQFHALLTKLGLSPSDVLRRDEPIARALGIGERVMSDDEMIRLMVENPDLIQRPIVVRGDQAVIARPLENIDKLL